MPTLFCDKNSSVNVPQRNGQRLDSNKPGLGTGADQSYVGGNGLTLCSIVNIIQFIVTHQSRWRKLNQSPLQRANWWKKVDYEALFAAKWTTRHWRYCCYHRLRREVRDLPEERMVLELNWRVGPKGGG